MGYQGEDQKDRDGYLAAQRGWHFWSARESLQSQSTTEGTTRIMKMRDLFASKKILKGSLVADTITDYASLVVD